MKIIEYISQGFLNAEAAPITTAITRPTPAPTEAPTAAADMEFALALASSFASTADSLPFANSIISLSFASSFYIKQNIGFRPSTIPLLIRALE